MVNITVMYYLGVGSPGVSGGYLAMAGFSFCFMYLRLGVEEARNPDTSFGTDQKNSNKIFLFLAEGPGKV